MSAVAAARLGASLGDENQPWPEQSTSAIALHHPQARYFNVLTCPGASKLSNLLRGGHIARMITMIVELYEVEPVRDWLSFWRYHVQNYG